MPATIETVIRSFTIPLAAAAWNTYMSELASVDLTWMVTGVSPVAPPAPFPFNSSLTALTSTFESTMYTMNPVYTFPCALDVVGDLPVTNCIDKWFADTVVPLGASPYAWTSSLGPLYIYMEALEPKTSLEFDVAMRAWMLGLSFSWTIPAVPALFTAAFS